MYGYTIQQWLFIFYLYCLIGWIYESTLDSCLTIKQEGKFRFVNRGFMRGPFLPLYGSGAVVMLIASAPFGNNIFLIFISGMVCCTILEYLTGEAMLALFKVRYWDYSNKKFNYKGHIWLWASVLWGAMTVIFTHYLHKYAENMMYSIPETVLEAIVLVLTIGIAADFALSFKAAIELRRVLEAMEKVREEMAHLQRRMEIIATLTEDELQQKKDALGAWVDEKAKAAQESIENQAKAVQENFRKSALDENGDVDPSRAAMAGMGFSTPSLGEMFSGVEGKFADVYAMMQDKSADSKEAVSREMTALRDRFISAKGRFVALRDSASNFFIRRMILGNPAMKAARKYHSVYEEWKKGLNETPEKEE